MKIPVLLVSLILFSSVQPAVAKGNGTAALDKVKALAGEWTGKDDDGQPCTLSYVVTSSGTAVLETLTPGKHPAMLSVYYLDGDHIMQTHFCSLSNQPRLRVEDYDPAGNTMTFDFLDITNLKNKDDGHINGLKMTMPDKDHLTQKWTYTRGDSDSSAAVFIFERKK